MLPWRRFARLHAARRGNGFSVECYAGLVIHTADHRSGTPISSETAMRVQTNDFPEHIERAIRALLEDGWGPVRHSSSQSLTHRGLSHGERVYLACSGEIIQRDGFHCRYCTGRVIPTPIMELLAASTPRYSRSNRPTGELRTHPAIAAGRRPSTTSSPSPTAAPCRSRKSRHCVLPRFDQGGLHAEQLVTLAPIRGTEWRGLPSVPTAMGASQKNPSLLSRGLAPALCPPST